MVKKTSTQGITTQTQEDEHGINPDRECKSLSD